MSTAGQTGPGTAVVTGGARGIGRGIATRLVADGYDVVLADRDHEITATADEIGARGVVCDVADLESVRALAAQAGPVRVLVNNAGVWHYTPLLDTPPDLARQVLEVNVVGTLFCIQAFADSIESGGAVVNLASITAQRVPDGVGLYGPSKAAVVALTQAAAVALGPRGIRVNAVAPGLVPTPGNAVATADGRREQLASTFPVPRMGSVDDIADVVAFLASDQSRYVTGQTVYADGGYLLLGPTG